MSTKTTNNNETASAEAHKAFSDHIAELRSRAFWVVVVFILASALAYSYREPLINIIMSPLGSQQLVYLTPGGGFSFIFQVTMYAGAVVAAPLMVFHLYRFLRPALPVQAQRNSSIMMFGSMLLMCAGIAFGYFVAIPSALAFLTTFAGDFVSPNLTAESYISFVMAYLVGLGILFQLPLFLIIWNWISPIKPGGLLDSQRYVVAFSFIAAAIITPTPDIINQSIVAVPIIFIYQIGVFAVFFINRKARRATQKHATLVKKSVIESENEKEKKDHDSKPTGRAQRPVMDVVSVSKPKTSVHSAKNVTINSKPSYVTQYRRSSVDGFIAKPNGRNRPSKITSVPKRPVVQKHVKRPVQPRPARSRMVTTLIAPSRNAVALDGFSIY